MPDLTKLKTRAHKLTNEAETEQLQARLQHRYAESWAMETDSTQRECLWLKIQILNDVFAELRILADGDESARE